MLRRVQDVRRHVNSIRHALLSPVPHPVAESVPDLELAVASLREVKAQTEHTNSLGIALEPQLRREVAALKSDLSVVAQLLEQGMRFHEEWGAFLATAASGYTATGKAATLTAGGQVSLEG